MKINHIAALAILREEAANATRENVSEAWATKVQRLSDMCEELGVRSHIAFLGTAMLAKSVDRNADLFVIKPSHAPDNPNAYSARALCHGVLVPFSSEEGISLGVNGPEPLNNQPYFRMSYLGDGTVVRNRLKPAFDYMVQLVQELSKLKNEAQAREALRAFILVRKKFRKTYAVNEDATATPPWALINAIAKFVGENSEGGKRAQAVVAGLLDLYADPSRVECGRVNDPSRHHPGDVAIRHVNSEGWEKAFEVRDKPVTEAHAMLFGRLCAERGVREAAIVMVSHRQEILDQARLQMWADSLGIGLTLFHGWHSFINQILFWSAAPRHEAANWAARRPPTLSST